MAQILGGVLISANLLDTAWRPIFLINLPIGAVVMVAALRFLPAGRSVGQRRLDLWGVATLSAAMLLAILPLILGHTQGWPAWLWFCLAASLVLFVAFIAIERRIAARGGYPLINLQVVAQPTIAWALAAFAAVSMTYFALLFILALYLQQGLGKSPLYSGLALVSWVAAFGIGGPAGRYLPARATSWIAPLGYLLLAASYLAISASLFTGYLGEILLVVLLGFGGFGFGTGYTANIRHLTAATPVRYASDMSGLITTFSQTAGVAGVAVFGTAYFGLTMHAGPDAATRGFAIVTAAFAVTTLLATIAVHRSSRATVAA